MFLIVKYLAQQNVTITIPHAGDTFKLGSATVQILAPLRDYEDPNDTSIVMKVVYGETSFLFTGDATRIAEADILEAGYDLSATVLKVGHHGPDLCAGRGVVRLSHKLFLVSLRHDHRAYGITDRSAIQRERLLL